MRIVPLLSRNLEGSWLDKIRGKTGDCDDDPVSAMAAREADDAVFLFSCSLQRRVRTFSKQSAMAPSELKALPRDIQLDPSVLPVLQQG
jgi:hypothetical protein